MYEEETQIVFTPESNLKKKKKLMTQKEQNASSVHNNSIVRYMRGEKENT